MTISKKALEQMRTLCRSICDDDGQDPRKADRKDTRPSNPNRAYRRLRLCRQIFQTLSLALSTARDPLLRLLAVDRVEPAAKGPAVIVRLVAEQGLSASDLVEIRRHLQSLEGWLRAEVAQSITRKRVPPLQFEMAPSAYDGGSEHGS